LSMIEMINNSQAAPTRKHDAGGKSRLKWPSGSSVSARFSVCERYRYELSEVWDSNKPLLLWILMNPSVANLDHSDPTLIKTGKYSRAWGFGGQLVGNVHAYRATNSNDMLKVDDPVGPENDNALVEMAKRSKLIVLAYGIPPKKLSQRGIHVAKLLAKIHDLHYLKLNIDGSPSHPLYLPVNLQPQKFIKAISP
jgi:hypothetical protein